MEDTTHSESSTKRVEILGEFTSLPARKIREDVCQHFGYRVGEYNGKKAHFAYYHDPASRRPLGAKLRFADKKDGMPWIGENKNLPLFGQHLCRDGGKKLVITEGEIDCLSVAQAQGLKWPVVSIENGAQGAVKSIKRQLEWIEKFDEVVFMFDMDEPGQKAARECAEVLTPGKAKIASLPSINGKQMKDASDILQAGKPDLIVDAIWSARVFRPDGIIDGAELWERISARETPKAVSYPWESMNVLTHGLRVRELVTFTAGTGVGKTTIVNEIAHHLISQGEKVGMLMLEQNVERTAVGLVGIELSKPLHISLEGVLPDDFKAAFDKIMGKNQVYLYDHFGSTDIDNMLNRVRYMAKSLGCQWVILDHLSIVVSGLDDNGDERKLIDRAMTLLRTLVEETGIGLILVSHLKRPEGKGHEEGAQTSLNQLRGSHAIAQLSDIVIGAERNQQADPSEGGNPNRVTIRVLKNRFSGETGIGAELYYDKHTGRLSECEPVSNAYANAEDAKSNEY